MLKKHARFFKSLFFISDLLILTFAWVLAYMVRFHTTFIRPPILGTPEMGLYLQFLPFLLGLWAILSYQSNLYRPRRVDHFFRELYELGRCLTLTTILLIALIYLFRRFEFSRLAFLYFWVLGLIGLFSLRVVLRSLLRKIRERGYNLRFALVAGTGPLGRSLLEKIDSHPELGIKVIGFLDGDRQHIGRSIHNLPILGHYEDLEKVLREQAVDIFFIALSVNDYGFFGPMVQKVLGDLPEVKVVPASYEFLGLRGGPDELDGLPLVSLQGSPLFGWEYVFKRLLDLLLGSLILLALSPLMSAIGLLIKITSKGPVLYRQTRVGMDGRPFEILKFRTMRMDAEKETGPIWASPNDPRRTKLGAFLRKTSLDELPQLINVLKGEMSLVGPRPERPQFVEEFRKKIPSYMLRHKIKAGMTGWAQINGWRGNTSIEKRIEYDLYYIQNWSIGFDLKILLMTLWKGFFSKSAY
ncbi:MAG: undecaprenyl-phosphate glucose phosphotransferase [Desulfobacterota bacterium]|nr:undecaprenyl-phosphate glucose phosphotransferase [Thermodesulfobacteriota bacterium]